MWKQFSSLHFPQYVSFSVVLCLSITCSEQCAATTAVTTPQPDDSTIADTTSASVTATVAGGTTTTTTSAASTTTTAPTTTTTIPTTTTTIPTTTTNAIACKSCSETIPMPGNPKPFASDILDTSGACAVRKLTCTAVNPSAYVRITANDQANLNVGSGTLTVTLTCNDQMQWTAYGTFVIMSLNCLYD